jgi:triosephosphate isomerase
MRQPILAANWKMHKSLGDAEAFVRAFRPLAENATGKDVVIAPPFPQLATVAQGLRGSSIAWAAQNVHPEAKGAFTGEVSPPMLADLGCAYTIVGHSERRALFGESSEFVSRKAEALLAQGIRPIVCVGETLEERESERTFDVVGGQLEESLSKVSAEQTDQVVVAYEPVWAIGTGRTATPEMAQDVHAFIRESLGKRFGAAGDAIRIQYGGSVKPDNAAALMAQPDIDGALVGGASLAPDSFAAIVRFDD